MKPGSAGRELGAQCDAIRLLRAEYAHLIRPDRLQALADKQLDMQPLALNQIVKADDLPASGCLVTDFNLPGINGLDLLDLLRERNVLLPAILITTHPTTMIRYRAASAGAHLIEKPLLNDTLFQCIRSALDTDSQSMTRSS